MTRLLTVTLNPALDAATETPDVRPDVKLRCTSPRLDPGGGGLNVARAITFLGGQAQALVALGGGAGATVRAMLEAEGLVVTGLGVAHHTRRNLSVTEAATGRQYRFVMPGPQWNAHDCETAANHVAATAQPGDILIASGSLPPGVPTGFFPDMHRRLAPQGVRMVLDTSGPALALAAARGGDALPFLALRMNRDEAETLAGHALPELGALADLTSDLAARGLAEIICVAAGSEGTVVASAQGRWMCPAPQVSVVSRIGAGDSFVAGFVLALSRGAAPVEACAMGVAAATSAVTTPGTGLCDRAATEAYLSGITPRRL